MTSRAAHLLYLALASAVTASAGCGPQGLNNVPIVPGLELGGAAGAKWRITFKDPVKITVTGAAGTVSAADLSMNSGSFKVEQATIQLPALCSRSDFVCPQNVFPLEVTVTQPDPMLHMLRVGINPKGPLALLPEPTLIGNVDSLDGFALLLGVTATGVGPCGLLGASTAHGTILQDPRDRSRGYLINGTVDVAYGAGCVVLGNNVGATGAGLTVKLSAPFQADRLP